MSVGSVTALCPPPSREGPVLTTLLGSRSLFLLLTLWQPWA